MPTKRKFYRTVLAIEVLSETPISACTSYQDILREAEEGDFSHASLPQEVYNQEIDGRKCAELLVRQGSDSGFFQLTDIGEDVEDYDG